tara:strand:- start:6109 stop:6618 length:510 start_codon:yes stop_codon:yes gene_type:complete
MKAICVLTKVENKKIKGFIEFDMVKKNKKNIMKISINIEGLKPGKHGFHIHEKGNLLEGCGSLCAHFNPDNTTHGDINDSKNNRHAGDLGNIIADKNGVCKQILYDKIIKLNGKYNIVGRSVVIHENEDDLGLGGLDENGEIIDKKVHKESLKTGNAGKRIACGIIGWK